MTKVGAEPDNSEAMAARVVRHVAKTPLSQLPQWWPVIVGLIMLIGTMFIGYAKLSALEASATETTAALHRLEGKLNRVEGIELRMQFFEDRQDELRQQVTNDHTWIVTLHMKMAEAGIEIPVPPNN